MAGIVSQDKRNANRGTVRGDGMLERSLQQYGAGRSALADRNGVLIAGNKAVAKAQELGIPVQLIPSDGKTLYVIQRTDLDLLTDDQAKELAIADNRAGQLNLDWDPDVLQSFIDDGIDLDQFWSEDELAEVLNVVPDVEFPEYTESVEDDVQYSECPECGHRFPK